jgi:hypothetical protein
MSIPSIYVSGSANVKRIPFRLRVLKSLSILIEQVNPDNGCHFDLRGKVFRGRVRFDKDDPIPMVSILEAPIPAEVSQSRGSNPKSTGNWELLIQGFADDDRANPSDAAHHMMAEVKAILAKEKQRENGNDMLGTGGRVFEMQIGQGSVRPPDDPTNEAFFWLTLTLKLAEDLEEPYL